MSARSAPAVALCRGSYRAEQAPGMVIVHATGFHPTSGHQAFFEHLPTIVPPPMLQLWHTKPTGIVLEVVTPFAITTTFPSRERLKQVTVIDAAGEHAVPVEQVPDHR